MGERPRRKCNGNDEPAERVHPADHVAKFIETVL
jgi:hypothetical protein